MDIEGKIRNGIFHFNISKQGFSRTAIDPVSTLVELKQIINLGIRTSEQNKFTWKIVWMMCCKDIFL